MTDSANEPAHQKATYTKAEVRGWLQAYVGQLLGAAPETIDPATSFELYGLESSAAVGLSGDLGDLLGHEFEMSLAYDYPTINALVDHLVSSSVVSPD